MAEIEAGGGDLGDLGDYLGSLVGMIDPVIVTVANLQVGQALGAVDVAGGGMPWVCVHGELHVSTLGSEND